MIVKITANILRVYYVSRLRYYYFHQYTEKETDVQRREMTDIKPPGLYRRRTEASVAILRPMSRLKFIFGHFFIEVKYT